jgi:mannose-6-phosphate isomerase-like protein (cupin superfamily)
MIVRGDSINVKEVENPRGGRGSLINMGYEVLSQFSGQIKMFSVVNLRPDSLIGYHKHEDDMEIYFMLDGTGVVNDNGNEDILKPGDMLITEKGESHSIENKSAQDITFLAMIIK